jgi:hypothetical protein
MTDHDEPSTVVRVGPDHRDLYLIIIGIVLGVLLGPAVLGRVSPQMYGKMFRGGMPEQRAVEQYEQDLETTRARIIESDATEGVALEEFNARPREDQIRLVAELQKARQDFRQVLVGRNVAIVLAVLALMLVETLLDPSQLGLRSRLATARYALLAVWLALMLAAPTQFATVPVTFLVGLVVMALVAALLPMGRRAST